MRERGGHTAPQAAQVRGAEAAEARGTGGMAARGGAAGGQSILGARSGKGHCGGLAIRRGRRGSVPRG
eukprot:461555-Pyramimonas_sp.AAC.1